MRAPIGRGRYREANKLCPQFHPVDAKLGKADRHGKLWQAERGRLRRGRCFGSRQAIQNHTIRAQPVHLQRTAQQGRACPGKLGPFDGQPDPVGIGNGQAVKRCRRTERALESLDPHVTGRPVREGVLDEPHQARTIIACLRLGLGRGRAGKADRHQEDQETFQNACPIPI